MNPWHFFALAPALLGIGGGPTRLVSSVTVEQTTIFRIPVRPHLQSAPMIEWQEHKGPKCLPAATLAGAMLVGPATIDFITRDRQRFRAEIDDDCTALDFYDGFYVQPRDDRLCARRDVISSRMGGSCRIERFRTLTPALRR